MPDVTKRILTDETGQDIVSALAALTNVVDPNGTTVAAAAKLNNMTVAATSLTGGSSPTASLTTVDNHFHLSLGIPHEIPAVSATNNGQILKVINGEWTADSADNVVSVSGTTPTIQGEAGTYYICGEVSTLTITPPATGIIDVIFSSGTTPTVLTVSPPSNMQMKWVNDFDTTALEPDTVYEINILNGNLGVVGKWEA